MAQYHTGKYDLTIADEAIDSAKAQMKAEVHVKEMMANGDMTIAQRIGYFFWLRQYCDAFFENMYEAELQRIEAMGKEGTQDDGE